MELSCMNFITRNIKAMTLTDGEQTITSTLMELTILDGLI